MLRVLGRSNSINVKKVLWVCSELGLAHHDEPWGSPAMPPLDSPEFLALNPNAMVPLLCDGDVVLWESNTICRYLAGTYGGEHLLPAAPRARADVEKWMDWQVTELNGAWRYAFMGLVRESASHSDPAAIAASVAEWNRLMRRLDAQLERTGAFVAGPTFTLADVGLGLSLNRWRLSPIERPALPALAAWEARLRMRPGYLEHGCNGTP